MRSLKNVENWRSGLKRRKQPLCFVIQFGLFFAVPKFLAQKSFSTLQGYNTFWAFQLYFSFVLISNVFLNTSNRIFNDVPPASSVWAYLFYVHMDILIVPRSEWTHAIWTLFFNSNYPGIGFSIQTKFKKWANKSQNSKIVLLPTNKQ